MNFSLNFDYMDHMDLLTSLDMLSSIPVLPQHLQLVLSALIKLHHDRTGDEYHYVPRFSSQWVSMPMTWAEADTIPH